MQKTWFITGASRGLGTHIAQAAIRAGDRVVATGRRRESVTAALGPDSDQLFAVALDVTDVGQVQAAIDAAVSRFGGIDVLVNNAGYGHLGFFEENAMEDVKTQFDTNLYGVFRMTWAALPVMRAARKGLIFNISSLGGLRGSEFGSLYCATKFAMEGFSEALAAEVKPFGISVTIIEPGPFRTDFLTPESLRIGGKTIADYDERRVTLRASFEERNGVQPGNPQKLADAMVLLANEAEPPMRFLGGRFAVDAADAKLRGVLAEISHWRELGISTDGENPS
jgi:NAD(P)-dependent dehydrogenase (short-subunit alcohol dehydrogenase family)